jgi:hypothetical protein
MVVHDSDGEADSQFVGVDVIAEHDLDFWIAEGTARFPGGQDFDARKG